MNILKWILGKKDEDDEKRETPPVHQACQYHSTSGTQPSQELTQPKTQEEVLESVWKENIHEAGSYHHPGA